MQRIITVIDDNGIHIEEGPAANEVIESIQWTTKKVVTRPRKAEGWLNRAVLAAAATTARQAVSEREIRRLKWGI